MLYKDKNRKIYQILLDIRNFIPIWIRWFIDWCFLKIYNKNINVSYRNFFQIWDIFRKKIKIGENTYIWPDWWFFAWEDWITIWKYCSIAWNFYAITYNHSTEYITHHINQCKRRINLVQDIKKGEIFIGNDVWIWRNVTVLSGVKIGNWAVIWACSVVTKDIPPYAIAAWNPCKVLKYRFTKDWIDYVQSLKWWDWNDKKIKDNKILFNTKVSELITK